MKENARNNALLLLTAAPAANPIGFEREDSYGNDAPQVPHPPDCLHF